MYFLSHMKTTFYAIGVITLFTLYACGAEHKIDTPATTESLTAGQEASSQPTAMMPITHNNKVLPIKLSGQSYVWTSSRTSNETEPPIDIKGRSYYDNTIRLHIRTGSNTIFDRTFQKSDFTTYLSEEFRQYGLLINLVGIGNQGNNLKFIATIGYPDGIDDEAFQSVAINITPTGEMSLTTPESSELEPSAHTLD